jgi:hypothetical protein
MLTSLSHRPGFVGSYYNDVTRRGIVTEMEEREWLAQRFDAHRTHLRAVAYRMLGSISEADDALQEAWLRLGGSDTSGVETLPLFPRVAKLGARASYPLRPPAHLSCQCRNATQVTDGVTCCSA